MRLLHYLTFGLFAALPVNHALAADPVRLEASSKWVVNYADNGCRLLRQFSTGDELVTMVMNRYGPGNDFQMTLAGKPLRRFFDSDEVMLQFGPAEQEQQKRFEEGTLGEFPALIFSSVSIEKYEIATVAEAMAQLASPPALTAETLTAVSYLSVKRKNGTQLILETGALEKPFAALTACTDNLVESCGFDLQREKTLQRRATPIGNIGAWIRTDDYPTKMLRAGQAAIVQVRLDVGPDGAVSKCHILETTRAKEFDDAVCQSFTKRAKFEPAIDSEGKAVASYWQRTVQFRLP